MPAQKPAEPQPDTFGSPLVRYFAATRPAFLSVTLVACLIGLASAWRSGLAPDPATAVVTVLFALVAHAAGNVINDYHDAMRQHRDQAALDRGCEARRIVGVFEQVATGGE